MSAQTPAIASASQSISVVIPSYNSARTIAMCLNGLRAQTLRPLEVIVVDSSSDNTAAMITASYPEVRLVTYPQRTLAGRARNIGAGLARGELLAFLDSDAVPEPDWLARLTARLNAECCGAVGGAIEIGNPNSDVAWAGHLMEFCPFFPRGVAHAVEHASSCNMLYRREAFWAVSGFPDWFFPFEDVIFSANARRGGAVIWFEPHGMVHHFPRERAGDYRRHVHCMGRMTFTGLRHSELPGSRICRNAALGLLAAPAIGAWKMARAIIFFVHQYPRVALTHPRIFALLGWGIAWWTRGFAEGALEILHGSSETFYSVPTQ